MTENISEQPKPSIKHDWYQTEVSVVITVLVKHVKEDTLKVHISNKKVHLTLTLPEQIEQTLQYNLAHEVVPEQCSYKVTPSKIEIKLQKSEGVRWEKLETEPEKLKPSASIEKPPAYPTSKGKDWSAIEKDIRKEEESEKPEGEEALNKLFQEIYGKGSDEVKKAMNKSYMESGGTVLSTNWNEIAKDKVKVQPPDGMEWKKWE